MNTIKKVLFRAYTSNKEIAAVLVRTFQLGADKVPSCVAALRVGARRLTHSVTHVVEAEFFIRSTPDATAEQNAEHMRNMLFDFGKEPLNPFLSSLTIYVVDATPADIADLSAKSVRAKELGTNSLQENSDGSVKPLKPIMPPELRAIVDELAKRGVDVTVIEL